MSLSPPLRTAAWLVTLAGFGCGPVLVAQSTTELAPLVVTAARAPQAADTLPLAVDLFTAAELHDSPSLTLDDVLRGSAAFSLFRRSGSLTANPTAQGVSLRGLAPSGTSRALVLLDGVPLNDPFGGWVPWSAVNRADLERVELVRGGGSGAWGNAALGGTIQLLSRPPAGDSAEVAASFGSFNTRSAEAELTHTTGGTTVRVSAEAFATDGVYLVQRPGPVDRPAESNHERAQLDLRHRLNPAVALTVTARYFAEDRGNGTPLQTNLSHLGFFSAALQGNPATDTTWSAVAYAQTQTFESSFSSVNATRTAETPANNQFDVPATAAGAALTWTHQSVSGGTTTAGADARWVEGETREDYSYSAVTRHFTRRRFAGGEQAFTGAFVQHEQALPAGLHLSLGARLDYWRNYDGHRRELDQASGTSTRDDHYAATEGVQFSPSAGLVWPLGGTVRLRAAGYRGFRVPTLNEYYRPFRVGSTVTEANPALSLETLSGAELGLDAGSEKNGIAVTGFVNELHGAVTNVTIAQGPGSFPLFGVLPAGGIGRQRQNLDALRVPGLELGAHFTPWSTVRLELDYLLNAGRVTSAPTAPTLVGLRLAEVPRHTLTARAVWHAPARLRWNVQLRWVSAQFEDDQNTLPLAAAAVVDLGVARPIGGGEIFLAVENLFSALVETGRTADGVVSVAPPRLIHGGVRWRW